MADEQNAYLNDLQRRIALANYQTNAKIRMVMVAGENMAVDATVSSEDVISQGGLQYYPSAGAATTVVSTSSEDTLTTGTGAFEVYIEGLIDGYVEASEVVTMTGLTPANCANDYLRINNVYVGECGIAGSNVGTIQIKHGANVLSEIQADGHGRVQNAVYTVPAGYTGYITATRFGMSFDITKQITDAYADCHLYKRSNLAPVLGWQAIADDIVKMGAEFHIAIIGETVRAGDDIRINVEQTDIANLRVTGYFWLMLIPD